MITYQYKLYKSHRFKHLDQMLEEACFVWNHALALQKRYHSIYGGYIKVNIIKHHFVKRIERVYLNSCTCQEILERLDYSYSMFFRHKTKRPPKFKNPKDLTSIVFKRNNGYIIENNTIFIKKIHKKFKFIKSRDYEGIIKRIVIKCNKIGEYFLYIVTDAESKKIGKSRRGASVGVDFGLKTYLTLSNGVVIDNPRFEKQSTNTLRKCQKDLSKRKKGSKRYEHKRIELNKLYMSVSNKRNDFQWKLAHYLCRKYDQIFIEDIKRDDINIVKYARHKLIDLSHSAFIEKLQYIATKYGVIVHKIEHYYPSSKTCTCGYVNKKLKLSDREWTCPHCGATHDRDLLAANNILRRGIYELESDSKTKKQFAEGSHAYIQ